MRVESYTVAHYGADWLGWALRSVEPFVDRMHVAYTPHPSHGHVTDAACPDSREAVMEAAFSVGSPKLRWHDVALFWQEGPQRDHALSLCDGADLALVVDCDEVWDGAELERFLRFAWDGPQRDSLVACRTPWRSFRWLCEDPMQPVRAVKKAGSGVAGFPLDAGRFWHFGYCVRSEVMRYKWRIHGHRGEAVEGWFERKWEPWPPVDDVHPTGCGPWNPRPMDRGRLPAMLREHPFWDMEPVP